MHTHQNSSNPVVTIGIDIGKNTFHLVGLDKRGAIVLRTKVSRSQLERRLANVPRCLVGLEAIRLPLSRQSPDGSDHRRLCMSFRATEDER